MGLSRGCPIFSRTKVSFSGRKEDRNERYTYEKKPEENAVECGDGGLPGGAGGFCGRSGMDAVAF